MQQSLLQLKNNFNSGITKLVTYAISLLGRANPEERLSLAQSIVEDSSSFSFAHALVLELDYQLRTHNDKNNKVEEPKQTEYSEYTDVDTEIIEPTGEQQQPLFEHEELSKISSYLIDRARREAGDKPLFELYPEETGQIILGMWPYAYGNESVNEYIQGRLQNAKEELYGYLWAFAPTVSVNGQQSFHASLTLVSFSEIARALDVHRLYDIAKELAGNTPAPNFDYNGKMPPKEITKEERLLQFIFLYEREKKLVFIINQSEND